MEFSEIEKLSKEELEFIMLLMSKGEYWELRRQGESYSLHDKDNNKYKGNLEQIKEEIE